MVCFLLVRIAVAMLALFSGSKYSTSGDEVGRGDVGDVVGDGGGDGGGDSAVVRSLMVW